jgi:hypothetical protein
MLSTHKNGIESLQLFNRYHQQGKYFPLTINSEKLIFRIFQKRGLLGEG